MSRSRWEYASVTWTQSLRKITRSSPEYPRLPEETRAEGESGKWQSFWWRTDKIYVWFPGDTEVEERIAWETGDENWRLRPLDVYNELGAEGWEMVSNKVKGSAMGKSYGRETTSFPIETSAIFKRPIDPS